MRMAGIILLLLFVPRLSADEKTTYQDQIKPLFTASCVSCHNPDKNKAGLDLTSYQATMTGSSAGKVVQPGDPDASTLYLVTAHEIEPHMPYKANKLPDPQIAMLRKWIEGGALETASANAVAMTKPKLEMKLASAPTSKPEGAPAMPKELSIEPIVRGERSGGPGAMAASPWAPLVAISQPHQILLFNTETRDLLGVLPFAEGLPKVLSFSRSGTVLLAAGGVGGRCGHASLFDVTTGRRLTDVGEEYDEVLAADLSPDQSMVALGGPGRVLKIFSTADGKLLFKLTQHTDWVTAIAYSPDGVLLASGDRNGGLRVWEANTAREFYTLNGHKGAITSLCFRADSNVLASASEDGTLKLWNMNDGSMIKSWAAHAEGALSVDFSRNGQLLSSGRDRVVRLWGGDGARIRDLPVMSDIVLRAIFAQDDSRIIAAAWNGEIKASNTTDGSDIGLIDANPPAIAERVIEARRKLAETESARTNALAALTAAQAVVNKTSTELQQAQAAGATAQKALEAAQAKLTTATETSKASAAALDIASKELAGKTAERDRLATASAQSTSLAQAAALETQARATEVEQRRAALDATTKAADAAKAELQKQPENPQLVKLAADAAAAVEKATADLAAAASSAAAADQKAKQLADTASKTASDLAAATSAAEQTQLAVQSQTAAHAKLLTDIAAITAEAQNAQVALNTANTAIQLHVDQLKAATDAAGNAQQAANDVAAQTTNAKSDLNKWKLAAVSAELIQARDQLANWSDHQAVLVAATEQLDAAGKTIQEGPRQIAEAQQRVAKATDARNAATSSAESIHAALSAREAVLKKADDLLNSLNTLASREPGTSISSAAQKAKESFDLLKLEAETLRKSATAADHAVVQSTSELSAAASDLQTAQAALASAPQKLEAARRSIRESLAPEIKAAQLRLDQLTAEAQRLTPPKSQ